MDPIIKGYKEVYEPKWVNSILDIIRVNLLRLGGVHMLSNIIFFVFFLFFFSFLKFKINFVFYISFIHKILHYFDFFSQVTALLEQSKIWAQYRDQKHDLFLENTPVAGYLTAASPSVAGFLTQGSRIMPTSPPPASQNWFF